MCMARKSHTTRSTSETSVEVSVNLDGTGTAEVNTGEQFLDHMITSLARHSGMDINVRTNSLDGIRHHAIEDTGIVLGTAICNALGERQGIGRFGQASIPMDESLAECSLDMIKRPYHKLDVNLQQEHIEGIPREDILHFFESLASNMQTCIHLRVMYGSNDHHKTESAIKALAVAMKRAMVREGSGAASTKGTM